MFTGFIGLGNMGRAMASRLVSAGHRVRVWNRTPKNLEGAETAASLTAIAEADQEDVRVTAGGPVVKAVVPIGDIELDRDVRRQTGGKVLTGADGGRKDPLPNGINLIRISLPLISFQSFACGRPLSRASRT